MSKVFPGFQDVRWLLASHKGAFLYVPMFVQTNLQNVETYYHSGGKKKKLQLANWLKEQHRSEVVLCSEGNQKLSVGSLYVILSLLPCWHHVLLQKMGFTQNKENMATVAPQLHP